MTFAQYKVKMQHISQYMYIFCRFDEVSAIRKPKMMTFSITGSQIFFRISLFIPKTRVRAVMYTDDEKAIGAVPIIVIFIRYVYLVTSLTCM